MKVGIGYCEEGTSFSSGQVIAKKALENGDIEKADLILAFSHGYEDVRDLLKGIKSVAGDHVPVIGGTASGIISNEGLRYNSRASVAAAIGTGNSLVFRFNESGFLDGDERKGGIRFAEKVKKEKKDKLLIIFFDLVKQVSFDPTSMKLVYPSRIIKGIEGVIGKDIPMIGAGLIRDLTFNPPVLFCGDGAIEPGITGLMLSGDIKPYIKVTHGQIPLDGSYYRITGMDGPNIYELGGRPIVDLIDELYGSINWRDQKPIRMLSIGSNYGKRFGSLSEAAYVSRVILGVTPDGRGIMLTDDILKEGDEIQFMLRDVARLMKSTIETAEGLMKEILSDDKRPLFGIYFDCGGRTALHLNSTHEEAHEVRNVFNSHGVPLLGIYSGCEIAPMMNRNSALSYTGVIMVLAED